MGDGRRHRYDPPAAAPLAPSFRGQPGWPDVVFWSPDGRFLTVGVGPGIPCNPCRADGLPYYAILVAGGKGVPLGTALAPGEAISWAPDGSSVVLSSPLGRFTYLDKHLFRVDPITGAQRALSHDWRWADTEPAVSPDRKHIAFARGRASLSTHLTPAQLIASRHVYLMDADGAHLRRLVNAPGWTDEVPVWSPDGQWLFFVRWRRHHQAAETALWAVRADGTNPQRIARLNLPAGFLNGFGFYGSFGWKGLFDVAPSCRSCGLLCNPA